MNRPLASTVVLGLHCLAYLAFITATTFGTYYVSVNYPEYFLKRFAPTLLGTSVTMLALWPFFGGCPLTWLENLILRKHHPSLQYQSSCTNHYAERWFGLCLPKKFSTLFLIGNMMFPAERWIYLVW